MPDLNTSNRQQKIIAGTAKQMGMKQIFKLNTKYI